MDTVPGLKALQSRKRDLLLESQLNRQLLQIECQRLRLSFERLRSGWLSGRNVWKWAAPVTGFIVARRFSRSSGLMAKGSLFVSIASTIWKLWSAFKKREPAAAPEV
jgi:hypothetical protein